MPARETTSNAQETKRLAHQLPIEIGCDQASAVGRLESFEAEFTSSVILWVLPNICDHACRESARYKPGKTKRFVGVSFLFEDHLGRKNRQQQGSTVLPSKDHNMYSYTEAYVTAPMDVPLVIAQSCTLIICA